jgi:hypothetical protein
MEYGVLLMLLLLLLVLLLLMLMLMLMYLLSCRLLVCMRATGSTLWGSVVASNCLEGHGELLA